MQSSVVPIVATKYFLNCFRLSVGTDCSNAITIPAPSKQYTAAQKKKGNPLSDISLRFAALARCKCSKSNQ